MITKCISRFAPSPTGRLHLGHAWSALQAHDLARSRGGQFLVRIEDIDTGRCRAEFVDGITEDLRWLGLAWDGPVILQSARFDRYQSALDQLIAKGLVYRCWCTRSEIAASTGAPQGDAGPAYPGTCRGRAEPPRDLPYCWRLDVAGAVRSLERNSVAPAKAGASGEEKHKIGALHHTGPGLRRGDEEYSVGSALDWRDSVYGTIPATPLPQGDVVIARKDTPTSYHLAVTLDDSAQGVTDVVRGSDLFEATHIHRLLQALLGLPTPRYHHHPLLAGPDGERLAKRHKAPTLQSLRAGGADPLRLMDGMRQDRFPFGFALVEA
jgi:glutamyl-Q tRNA(Asp) synthetase